MLLTREGHQVIHPVVPLIEVDVVNIQTYGVPHYHPVQRDTVQAMSEHEMLLGPE
jgi:hypothetical protein